MAANNSHFLATLPILDVHVKNFNKWCTQMKVIFGYKDACEIFSNGLEPLGENDTDTHS